MPSGRISKCPVVGVRQLWAASTIGPSFDKGSDPAALPGQCDEFVEENSLANAAQPVEDPATITSSGLAALEEQPDAADSAVPTGELRRSASRT